MKIVSADIVGVGTYSQSRFVERVKAKGESEDACETRTWRDRCHYDEKGEVFIPQMSFHNALCEAVKMRGEKIKGKGQATYTKYFERGLVSNNRPQLLVNGAPVTREQLAGERLLSAVDGNKQGKGKKVMRIFPVFQNWSTTIEFVVIEPLINEELFADALKAAGLFIGVGRWRPENRGLNGRFKVGKITWREDKAW